MAEPVMTGHIDRMGFRRYEQSRVVNERCNAALSPRQVHQPEHLSVDVIDQSVRRLGHRCLH